MLNSSSGVCALRRESPEACSGVLPVCRLSCFLIAHSPRMHQLALLFPFPWLPLLTSLASPPHPGAGLANLFSFLSIPTHRVNLIPFSDRKYHLSAADSSTHSETGTSIWLPATPTRESDGHLKSDKPQTCDFPPYLQEARLPSRLLSSFQLLNQKS